MPLRPATATDMDAIYMMGFETWAGGESTESYLNACRNSPKYKKGQWYVLEDGGQIVSSLICYTGAFGLAPGSMGIGSIATSPNQRRKGYATLLVKGLLEQLKRENVRHIFLYADTAPAYYEKLGFRALGDNLQKHQPSLCMVHGQAVCVPSYF